MVAVVATAFGGPEVLALVDSAPPAPGRGEVSIAVRAAGTNPVDVKTYSGSLGSDPAALPLALGWEVSGVVTAVGPDAVGRAGRVRVGDEVIAFPVTGGYADALTVPALTGAGIVKGTTVLVHGVSGAVGLAAAQIALADGATVVGTAGERHHEGLRARGVIPVAYGDGLLERVRQAAPDGVDGVVDAVGTDEAVDVSLALVRERRLVVSAAGFGRAGDGITLIGFAPGVEADPGTEIRDAARLRLTALVDDGKLEVVVARTFALGEAAAAHELLAGGHAGGKVVLLP